MKNKLLLAFILIPSVLWANPKEYPQPPMRFGYGVNLKDICSQIDDASACDGSNFISTNYGSIEKRDGSKRFLSQAISSYPITSAYRAYISTNSSQIGMTVVANRDRIYFTTDTDRWRLTYSSVSPGQHYSFETIGQKVVYTGDGLLNHIKQFDLFTSSVSNLIQVNNSTSDAVVMAKYLTQSKNYLIAANVALCSTATFAPVSYHPNRIYYSLLAQQSSFTATRYIEIRTPNLEPITGIFVLNDAVEIAFPNFIYQLTFTNLDLTALGGDWVVGQVVDGFGFISPRSIASDGRYVYGLSNQGVIQWDGGRKTRLDLKQEQDILSNDIEPLIRRVIQSGTYRNAHGIYYARRNWYILQVEDPTQFPKSVPNTTLVYDLVLRKWFIFRNWNAECFMTQDGDLGELYYGDSMDGYLYLADDPYSSNDARKEKPIESMDSPGDWLRGQSDLVNVKEGTGSIRLNTTASVLNSSVTRMGVYDFSRWPDGRQTTGKDKISFKVYVASFSESITKLNLDLEINDEAVGEFDTNFATLTINGSELQGHTTGWVNFEIPISSIPVLSTWTALGSETFPHADSKTYFGLRFNLVAVGPASVAIDDLRLVQDKENPLHAYWLSKQFNFGTNADKKYSQILLDAETNANTDFSIDVYRNFGKTARTINVNGGFDKELYACGLDGQDGVFKLNTLDYAVEDSTVTNPAYSAYRAITTDKDSIYATDRYNHRLIKFDKTDLSTPTVSVGSGGLTSKNFYNTWQIAVDNKRVYACDTGNHAIKVLSKKDLTFIYSFGSLGTGTTNFHVPTGIAVDDTNLFVWDDGNKRLMKFDKKDSTCSFSLATNLVINTFGSGMLALDEEYIYSFYNVIHSTDKDKLRVILDKRRKSDLSIVDSIVVEPSSAPMYVSTYNVLGNPALGGDYIYLSFTDNANGVGNYYIQKRLKSDFTLISERISDQPVYGLASVGLSYEPRRKLITENLEVDDANYIQFRLYDDGLDNKMKFYGQSLSVIPREFKENK